MNVDDSKHTISNVTEVDQQDILEFFKAANSRLVKSKLQKYGIISENGLGRRISMATPDTPITCSLIDLIPVDGCRSSFKNKLKGRYGIRKSLF
jgi:hypothetical protein